MDVKVAMPNGQVGTKPIEEVVFANLGNANAVTEMPGTFEIPLAVGGANGVRRFVLTTADVFFASIIAMVSEARAELVAANDATDAAQQEMLAQLDNTLVTTPISTGLAVPFTATVALLVPTDKVVSVALPGIVKDELVIANPISLPVGWGYKGVKAGAANRLDFALSLPAIALNGTGTCTFNIYAQRKLVP